MNRETEALSKEIQEVAPDLAELKGLVADLGEILSMVRTIHARVCGIKMGDQP